jgi:hypothetical protein
MFDKLLRFLGFVTVEDFIDLQVELDQQKQDYEAALQRIRNYAAQTQAAQRELQLIRARAKDVVDARNKPKGWDVLQHNIRQLECVL